jgi:hypothetical protein
VSPAKENPFNARRKKKALKPFKAKKVNKRFCKFKVGQKVRLTWRQYPSLGGKTKFSVGRVIAVEWSTSGATVVIMDKEHVTMRHCLFAPGNSKLKAVG